MKRKIKSLITAFSVCAVSAFAVMGTGCNSLKESINELRCDHVLIDGEVTKEPTCKEEGEMVRECTLCTYTETKTLDKLKHSVVILKAVAPTCTASGLTEGQQCADCEEILVAQKVVTPTGHTLVTDKAVEPTCSTAGKTEGNHCKDCDTVFTAQEDIPMLEHVLKETEAYGATCEENGFTGGVKCENCDYATEGEIIPALGHSYDEGEVTTEATCEVDGEKTFTCATCEGTRVEVIPALGHTYEDGTCTVCGVEENVDTVEISGTWVFDSDPDLKAIRGKVTFISNGVVFTEIVEDNNSLYYCNDNGRIYVCELVPGGVGENGWVSEAYRTITFDGIQNISQKLKNGFENNAEKMTIGFTIDGECYYADVGMTWGEWVGSEYSKGNYYINEMGEIHLNMGGSISLQDDTGTFVKEKPNFIIQDNATYILKGTAGGGSN